MKGELQVCLELDKREAWGAYPSNRVDRMYLFREWHCSLIMQLRDRLRLGSETVNSEHKAVLCDQLQSTSLLLVYVSSACSCLVIGR